MLRVIFKCREFQLWHCRQSALLVMKYYFAVATASDSFDRCFKLVVSSLNDPVDDVSSGSYARTKPLLSGQVRGLVRAVISPLLLISSFQSPLPLQVVCCAVNTLSSFIANQSTDQKRADLVERIMHNIWQLLEVESKKDQVCTISHSLIGLLH